MSYVSNGILYVNDSLNGGGAPGTFNGTAYSGEIVISGGNVSNQSIYNDGMITVSSGGRALNSIISSGGTLTFTGGGTGTLTNLLPGGTLNIGSGTTYNILHQPSLAATSGAQINVLSGGTLANADAGNGGTITVSSGGIVFNSIISSGGTLTLMRGGAETDPTLLPGSTLNIGFETTYSTQHRLSHYVTSGSQINVLSGGALVNADAGNGGTITVSSGGTVVGLNVRSGANFSASQGATLSGVTTLENGGSATIWNNAGGVINLVGNSNAGLTIDGLQDGGTVTTAIRGWSGSGPGNSDSISLPGVSAAGATYAYPSDDQVVIMLANGKKITFNIPNVKNTGFGLFSDGKGGAQAEVCFLAGSVIQTPTGTVAVEDLTVGDEIIAYVDGVKIARRVVWAGKKQCTVRPHLPDDEAGYPVRILKDAIADGVPFKDMLITAEHCLFFDGKFVPVRMLVNRRSIFYDRSITSYDYYHVETEQHSVIMADGMLTESYLDTGNRSSFRHKGTVVSIGAKRAHSWNEDAAGPLAVSRDIVEPLFRGLETRATEAGIDVVVGAPELTDDTNLHLTTEDGMIIRPAREANGRMMFLVPAGINSVRIVSNTGRPSDAIGPFVDDRRHLGVLIGEITLFESTSMRQIENHLTQDDLIGWDVVEACPCRWTNGNAVLPLGTRPSNSVALLAIQIKAAGPYLVADILENQAQKTA